MLSTPRFHQRTALSYQAWYTAAVYEAAGRRDKLAGAVSLKGKRRKHYSQPQHTPKVLYALDCCGTSFSTLPVFCFRSYMVRRIPQIPQ